MNQKIFRAAALVVSVCALSLVVTGQQPAARTRRGGLDNLSLPSTAARVAAASTGAGAATWLTFAPEGAGFAVSVPGMPEEATAAGRERGQLAAQFRSYRLAAGGLKYEIGRTGQMSEQFVSQPEYIEKFFAGARQGITAALEQANQQIKFRLVSEQAISLEGYEGREYEFDAEGHRAVARLFIIERSLFALSVLGAKSEMTPDKVNKFLDSFALAQ